MSSILVCPDYADGLVNLVGSMKPFIIESSVEVAFTLEHNGVKVIDEVYMPILSEPLFLIHRSGKPYRIYSLPS